MPISWLKPALAVKRSALAPSTAVAAALGLRLTCRLVASMSAQVDPSLLALLYCCVLEASEEFAVGTISTLKRVGEYRPLIGPAPAKMVAPAAFLFVFHFSLNTYVLPVVTG